MTSEPLRTRTRTRTNRSTVPRSARLSFVRVLRSEILKLATLRSTWWTLGISVVLSVGIALLVAAASRDFGGDFPAVTAVTAPMQFTMLVAGIFGAIAITGEYSTGMIRSTLAAEPRRGAIVVAKAIAVAGFLLVTAVISTLVAVLATAPILGDAGLDWSDADASIVPLTWSVLAMAAFGLIGLGWGFIIRNGAGAIAATVGLLFVAPIILNLFSIGGEAWQWLVDLGQYLPMNAASALAGAGGIEDASPVIALLAWPLGTLVLGWVILRVRDA